MVERSSAVSSSETLVQIIAGLSKMKGSRLEQEDYLTNHNFSSLITEFYLDVLMALNFNNPGLATIRQSGIAKLYLFEFVSAWTQCVKAGIHQNLPYAQIEATIEEVYSNIMPQIGLDESVALQIKGQIQRFLPKYTAQIFGSGLGQLTSSNKELGSQIGVFLGVLSKNHGMERALLEIVWKSYSAWLKKHLLFIAIPTSKILAFIYPRIQVLLTLDKSGFLLENMLKEIKLYLQTYRKQKYGPKVIKIILELAKVSSHFSNSRKVTIDIPDIDQRNFDSVMFGDIRGSTKTGDIFAILANLFDSSAELILEYKKYLISTMTARSDNDHGVPYSRELFIGGLADQLRRMKAKFQGDEWRECDVIIKDYEASSNLKSGPFGLTRISQIYWPEFEPLSGFIPAGTLQNDRAKIEAFLEEKEPSKIFEITNSHSHVELELEFSNATLEVKCNADEASLIILMSSLKVATITELRMHTGFDGTRLRNALCKWVRERIVQWNRDEKNFTLPEEYMQAPHLIDCYPESWNLDLDEDAKAVANLTVNSELSKVLPLICGVLSNLGPMPLGGIQSHLQKVSIRYNSPECDLYVFLESHVSSGLLYTTTEGFYHVKNKI